MYPSECDMVVNLLKNPSGSYTDVRIDVRQSSSWIHFPYIETPCQPVASEFVR